MDQPSVRSQQVLRRGEGWRTAGVSTPIAVVTHCGLRAVYRDDGRWRCGACGAESLFTSPPQQP